MAGNKRWTQDQLDFLQENYGRKDIKIIAKKLSRSLDAVHWKAKQLGIGHQVNEVLNLNDRMIRLEKKMDAILLRLNEIYR